jgi:hypothetical protein
MAMIVWKNSGREDMVHGRKRQTLSPQSSQCSTGLSLAIDGSRSPLRIPTAYSQRTEENTASGGNKVLCNIIFSCTKLIPTNKTRKRQTQNPSKTAKRRNKQESSLKFPSASVVGTSVVGVGFYTIQAHLLQ